jgi:hypothetical protein
MPPHRGAAGPSPTYPVQMPPHRAQRGHLQPTRYKCEAFVPGKVTLRLQSSIILHPPASLSLISFFCICSSLRLILFIFSPISLCCCAAGTGASRLGRPSRQGPEGRQAP